MLKIKSVKPGSIGHQLRLKPGDEIISLNGSDARDIVDYFFHTTGEELTLRVKSAAGKLIVFEIEKGYDEDIGLEIEINPRRCQNKCVFCFIDQQPPDLRRTLYIKDDDYRLSFLEGNYITLTNLREEDITRIIQEKLSPLYVSVHSTDSNIRGQLLGRKQSSDILGILRRFAAAGIDFHSQIVLCPGFNDGDELEKTIADLTALGGSLLSLAVVPVGLTKYREDLTPLVAVDRECARRTIEIIDSFQAKLLGQGGRRVVYGADEFYVKAGLPVPGDEYYEDYPQLENGVGMIRKTLLQAEDLHNLPQQPIPPFKLLLITGIAARETMEGVSKIFMALRPGLEIQVVAVENSFLGPEITVAGLLAGADIFRAVSSVPGTWDALAVPEVAVRAGCFLDDWTREKLALAVDKAVYIAEDLMDIITLSGNGGL